MRKIKIIIRAIETREKKLGVTRHFSDITNVAYYGL